MLQDSFGRIHDYLRISLIDKCNLRCTYCMPSEDMMFLQKKKLMTADEIVAIASQFVELGVNKIRLTGGEPLLRNDFQGIFSRLAEFPVQLHMTTNGVFLDKHFDFLVAHGMKDINISLDTLDKNKFQSITQRDQFEKVGKNIDLAIEKGLKVKINVVLMKGVNENEILPFIELTKHKNISIRFIEFMPFDGNQWDYSKAVLLEDILEKIRLEKTIQELPAGPHETSKNYQVKGYQGDFGIISTVSSAFCAGCNRIRLTADGKIKNCLFATNELDLLSSLREGKEILPTIQQSIRAKKKSLGGMKNMENEGSNHQNRSMIAIGG